MDLFTITAATILSMYLNANGTDKYFYNADMQNDKICTMDVYEADRYDGSLTAKIEYHFTYDEQNRLTEKEAYRWNSLTSQWMHYYRLSYDYNSDGYSLERSDWDTAKQTYDNPTEKSVYKMNADDVLAVTNYKWDKKMGDYVMTDNMLVLQSQNDNLLAHVRK